MVRKLLVHLFLHFYSSDLRLSAGRSIFLNGWLCMRGGFTTSIVDGQFVKSKRGQMR